MRFPLKKEPVAPRTGLLGNADDYAIYHYSPVGRVLTMLLGAAAGAVASYTFYQNLVLSALVAAIGALVYPQVRKKRLIELRKDKLLLQFRDCLESLSASLGAGSNVPKAFLAAAEDMRIQYGEDSDIFREIAIVNAGLQHSINVEELLRDFGERSGIIDIRNFADVFEISYRKSGNIRDVVKNAYQIICDKLDVQLEINTAVAGVRIEQNAMLVMPVVFMFLMRAMGSDMIDLHSAQGLASTTVGLACFAVAYFAGRKILSIEL